MNKVGRNDPCPCGSGKKYKKCCEGERLAAAEDARPDETGRAPDIAEIRQAMAVALARELVDSPDELGKGPDGVTELIDAGRLDEAEQLARQLEADYPDEQVGAESLALVCEARGLAQAASEHYRRAVAAMDALGRGKYCDCCRARMVKAVRRLDPDGPALVLGIDPQ